MTNKLTIMDEQFCTRLYNTYKRGKMEYIKLALRFIHIVGGTFWVGAALLMNFFIAPTLRATGDAGRQFAGHFMGKTRFAATINISAYATIIAGVILYGLDSAWFTSEWMKSGAGFGFSIGAIFGLIGFVTGAMNGNNNRKLAKVGSEIKEKPTAEQAATLQAIAKQQAWVVPVNGYTLLLAITFMATARYLTF